ncbi:MAG: type II toxin-antitoxin system RelE/ParE family toxin [Phycisphaeraceae bacterium]
MPIIRSRLAEQDYAEIWDYIAERNPDAADRLLRQIDAKLESYLDTPNAGTPRDEIMPGLRSFPVGRYVVLYRPVADGIELIRILHGARDLGRAFHGETPDEI